MLTFCNYLDLQVTPCIIYFELNSWAVLTFKANNAKLFGGGAEEHFRETEAPLK